MRRVCKPEKKAILELKLNGQKPQQMHSVRQSNIIIKKKKERKKYNSSQRGSFHGDIASLATGRGITSLQGSEQKARCFSDFSNGLSVLCVLFHDSDHVIREFPFCYCFA